VIENRQVEIFVEPLTRIGGFWRIGKTNDKECPPGGTLNEDAMSLEFAWNDRKARTNLQKDRVDFVEVASVFSDPLARIFLDEGHSTGELREIIIGHSSRKRILLVLHGA